MRLSRTRRALLAAVAAAALSACAGPPEPLRNTFHGSDADVGATRILHGSLVVEVRGTRFLIDPWYHGSTLMRQREPIGILPDALPDVAAVLLTSGSAGHFDPDILREIAKKKTSRIVGPAPLADRLRDLGFTDVVGIAPWERVAIDGVDVTATPTSDDPALLGYVLAKGPVRAYLAGDTRPFPELVDVATAFPKPDVAFLPIGGRRVMGLLRTMSPAQAAAAAKTLDPAAIIPIDYGAAQGIPPFAWRPGDPVGDFRDELQEVDLESRLVVLQPGESWHRYSAK
jgi:L-ascorbate metabolism protein UlaG (beta-lactamase superfamily)